MADESLVKSTAEAVKGVVDAVPVYQDAVQPAAKEIGKALQTVAKTVHVALAPLSVLVWGYDRISEFLDRRVPELLENVPPDRIVTPDPAVAGPALESLRFTANEPDLREMYARLLATAMDVGTVSKAHPAFVEAIKQLSADEARILKWLSSERYRPQPVVTLIAEMRPPTFPAGGILELHRNVSLLPDLARCAAPFLGASYLDNLARLGLIRVQQGSLSASEAYKELENSPKVRNHLEASEEGYIRHKLVRGYIKFTDFGQQFISACILSEHDAEEDSDIDREA